MCKGSFRAAQLHRAPLCKGSWLRGAETEGLFLLSFWIINKSAVLQTIPPTRFQRATSLCTREAYKVKRRLQRVTFFDWKAYKIEMGSPPTTPFARGILYMGTIVPPLCWGEPNKCVLFSTLFCWGSWSGTTLPFLFIGWSLYKLFLQKFRSYESVIKAYLKGYLCFYTWVRRCL